MYPLAGDANLVGMNQNTFNAWDAIRATALWWSPIVAGFIGAFGTHLLTQSRDREKWILDNKKQEYRELLSALSDSYVSLVAFINSFSGKPDESETKQFRDSVLNLTRVVRDRLYITEDMDVGQLLVVWRQVTERFFEHRNVDLFCDEYKVVSNLIIS